MGQFSCWLVLALALVAIHPSADLFVQGDVGPSESECRPYIEKALHQFKGDEAKETVLDVDVSLGDEEEVAEGPPPADVESPGPVRVDTDGDGIPNEEDEDIDGDVIPNEEDEDLDGDGILNVEDTDIDGDGVSNVEDSDLDGDGVPNIQDNDLDGDGIPNDQDDDIDGDGIPNDQDDDIDGDGVSNSDDDDIDGDGIPNDQDNDIDGDGIPNDKDEDIDGDGILNVDDNDMDGDGIPNDQDGDIDGDGLMNEDDNDIDGDGIPNEDDNDIDGDGIPNYKDNDIDGDGIPNDEDSDVDGDGIPNDEDQDVDGDGLPNEEEPSSLDIDGDGVLNDDDVDIDGDVILNELDEDMDGDGIPNTIDRDIDGDGIPNIHDEDKHEPVAIQPGAKQLEDVMEQIVEAAFEAALEEPGVTKTEEDTEAAEEPTDKEAVEEEAVTRQKRSLEDEEPAQQTTESDTDGDGIPDHEDDDMDGDGIPNHLDNDVDGDGILNEDEVDHEDYKERKEVEEETTEEAAAEAAEEEQLAPEAELEESESADTTEAKSDEAEEETETEEPTTEAEEEDIKPEDELLWEGSIPEVRRSRDHINELLQLDEESSSREKALNNIAQTILRDIKRIYENAIKPLENLYKYRDLSNRHFSDPEIFSKPLILFMGPWSGGKSTIINYLTDNEYTMHSLRSGAEPSPAYFNILMWGNETEILDGTQLAADYTFAGLQKFGQGLEDRLRGLKMPNKLLEKVNIVEIPGILEVRREVSRMFPFNDACQWFIDRADIICLVYDPAKLDVGPETEAILDQLKGREHQTRIILNKADTVKPEELLRVQSALIWNISPLMSSAQPPLIYTTSLWSHPYQEGSPARLLLAQERAILRDLRSAVDKRIENRIASARRFAVRVRNHAKMVDCYLNTYYNHKTLFSNKKRVAEDIISSPQNYHIYEGLSTLTNISRYDLPDPEVYRDFFHLNPLYEFKKLSESCSYFGGCPLTKLDIAIAYDLPDLVGKYKKMAESALSKFDAKEDLR